MKKSDIKYLKKLGFTHGNNFGYDTPRMRKLILKLRDQYPDFKGTVYVPITYITHKKKGGDKL